MTYGFKPELFVEDGPAIQAAAASARSSARFAAWQALDSDDRFEVVEQALKTPADLIRNHPIAL